MLSTGRSNSLALEQGQPLLNRRKSSHVTKTEAYRSERDDQTSWKRQRPFWHALQSSAIVVPLLSFTLLLLPLLLAFHHFSSDNMKAAWEDIEVLPDLINKDPSLFVKTQVTVRPVKIGQASSFTLRMLHWNHSQISLVWNNTELEPTFIAYIENDYERLAIEGQRLEKGLWNFPYTLYTPGIFNVTCYLEGDFPWHGSQEQHWRLFAKHLNKLKDADQYEPSDADIFDRPPPYIPTDQFELHVKPLSDFQELPLQTFLDALPPCNSAHLSMQGRWLSIPQIQEHGILHPAIPKSYTAFDQLHLPDACYIPWRTDEESQSCFKNKNFLALGDSTLKEVAVDLGLTMSGLSRFPKDFKHSGTTTTCWEAHSKARHFYWPQPSLRSSVSLVWACHYDSCANGFGIQSFEREGMRRRFRQALLIPSSIPDLPVLADETSDRIDHVQDPPFDQLPIDILAVDSGMHDMVLMGAYNSPLSSYKFWLEEFLKFTVPLAKQRILQLINPRLERSNYIVRQLNAFSIELAKTYNFTVIDNYSRQLPRFNAWNKRILAGDITHSSMISYLDGPEAGKTNSYLHATTLAMINLICTEDEI